MSQNSYEWTIAYSAYMCCDCGKLLLSQAQNPTHRHTHPSTNPHTQTHTPTHTPTHPHTHTHTKHTRAHSSPLSLFPPLSLSSSSCKFHLRIDTRPKKTDFCKNEVGFEPGACRVFFRAGLSGRAGRRPVGPVKIGGIPGPHTKTAPWSQFFRLDLFLCNGSTVSLHVSEFR